MMKPDSERKFSSWELLTGVSEKGINTWPNRDEKYSYPGSTFKVFWKYSHITNKLFNRNIAFRPFVVGVVILMSGLNFPRPIHCSRNS